VDHVRDGVVSVRLVQPFRHVSRRWVSFVDELHDASVEQDSTTLVEHVEPVQDMSIDGHAEQVDFMNAYGESSCVMVVKGAKMGRPLNTPLGPHSQRTHHKNPWHKKVTTPTCKIPNFLGNNFTTNDNSQGWGNPSHNGSTFPLTCTHTQWSNTKHQGIDGAYLLPHQSMQGPSWLIKDLAWITPQTLVRVSAPSLSNSGTNGTNKMRHLKERRHHLHEET